MVADQHDLTRTANQRHQRGGLCGLSGLVDEDTGEPPTIEELVARADAGATQHLRPVEDVVAHLRLYLANLLPSSTEIAMREPLLLTLHPFDATRELLIGLQPVIEVTPKRMLLHPGIHRGLAQALPDFDRLSEAYCPDT